MYVVIVWDTYFCVNNRSSLTFSSYFVKLTKNDLTACQLNIKVISFDVVRQRQRQAKKDNLKNLSVYSNAKTYHK